MSMDAETQERFAKAVGEAWIAGDEAAMQSLCRDYEVSIDPDDPLGTVTILAAPASSFVSERVEFTVVKAAA